MIKISGKNDQNFIFGQKIHIIRVIGMYLKRRNFSKLIFWGQIL